MITPLPIGREGGPRDGVLAAGIRLFAERGFTGTPAGDIEAAAGLQPRRGAMYHYFPSKQALLEAAVQNHLVVNEHGRRQLDSLPHTDVRSEALLMGRFFLAQLDVQRYLTTLLERDGDRLPELRDSIRERVMEVGHRAAEELIRRWAGEASSGDVDAAAHAVVIVAPLG